MLVMTLRTVTLDAPCRCCACSTTSSIDVPCSRSRSSSQPRAGVVRGSWSRSRLASCAAKSSDSGARRAGGDIGFQRRCGRGRAPAAGWPAHAASVRARAAGGDLVGEAAQVLDQHDAQGDRDGPQLADGERLHALVGGDEAAQGVGIEVAVGVRDEGPGEAEHARIAGERARGQFRQLAVVAGRQVVADLADLLLDQVVVVEQPFGRRHDTAAAFQFGGAGAIGGEQHGGVVVEPPVQRKHARAAWP